MWPVYEFIAGHVGALGRPATLVWLFLRQFAAGEVDGLI
jgi:hypothetical protein